MQRRTKTIAVTGATGFLGRYIVDALLERSAHVVGVVRNPGRVPELARRGVELRQADLLAPDRLRAGFQGVDAVVSNAALFDVNRLFGGSSTWEEHNRTNIQGTRNVFEAVVAAGVRRVVHVSSVAVYAAPWRQGITEDAPQFTAASPHTLGNAYQLSKALSEQLAWKLARRHGLALTTVRPSAIYGAFDPNFTARLKTLLGLPVGVFPVLLQFSLVYAGDVAEGIVRALERPVSIGKAYNLTGGTESMWDFLTAWKKAGGYAPRWVLPLPVPLRQSFDHSRATRDLRWHNRPLVEALRDTFRREAGRGGSARHPHAGRRPRPG